MLFEKEEETRTYRKKKKKPIRKRGDSISEWEELGQRGVLSIDSLPGGGIVSGQISSKGLRRIGRRMLSIGKRPKINIPMTDRDGDGDGKRTNPLTGKDDLPVLPEFPKTLKNSQEFNKYVDGMIDRLVNGGTKTASIKTTPEDAQKIRGRFAYWQTRAGTGGFKTTYSDGVLYISYDETIANKPNKRTMFPGEKRKYEAAQKDKRRERARESARLKAKAKRDADAQAQQQQETQKTPRKGNDAPYVGDSELVAQQAQQLSKFEDWAESRNWQEFHTNHFDWWTFPIDRGSHGYGFSYDVSGEPVQRLKNNNNFLRNLSRAAQLYNMSLGWDMINSKWIDKSKLQNGQGIKPERLNQQRLFKIGRSLQIHGLGEDFESHRKMVQSLRKNGMRVGNEEFWDNPANYQMVSRFKNSGNSISGKMGIGISPNAFKNQDKDPSETPRFLEIQKKRDIRNERKDGSSNDLTFDWMDEASRIEYRDMVWKSNFKPGYAKWDKIAPGGRWGKEGKTGLAPQLEEILDLLADVGIHWGKGGKEYNGFYDQYGMIFMHSKTPNNPDTAAGAQARDLKGYLAPTINPNLYWQRFESWIRNPFSVMRDPKTGREVGVRKYFNNDRDAMINEFNKRISKLYDAISEAFGKDKNENKFIPLPKHANPRPRRESVPQFIINEIKREMDSAIQKMSENSSIEGVRKRLSEFFDARGIKDIAGNVTKEWLEDYLKQDYPEWLAGQLKRYPDFLKSSVLDSLTNDELQDARDMMWILHSEEITAGRDPKNLDVNSQQVLSAIGSSLSLEQRQKLHEDELKRSRLNK